MLSYPRATSATKRPTKSEQTVEGITWTIFGNFLSIPTDCPQRNERMGWDGDLSAFLRSTYMANLPGNC